MPVEFAVVSMLCLLVNLFVVMPLMAFFGYSLASVINANEKSLQHMGKLTKEGETGLTAFKIEIVQELRQRGVHTAADLSDPSAPVAASQLEASLSPATPQTSSSDRNKAAMRDLFNTWASATKPPDKITVQDIRRLILAW